MNGALGALLQRAARLHRARMAETLQDIGLFPGQEQVILLLDKENGRTVGDLADALDVKPPTVSKTLQRLSVQGLVERREHDDDARKTRVFLTAEGQGRAKSLHAKLEKVEEEMAAKLDGKDVRRLRKMLKRMAKSLSPGLSTHEPDDEDGADDSAGD